MPRFPLPSFPPQEFNQGGLSFGNDRGKVDHAACDLVAAAGTNVFAVANGVVWYGPVKFFESKPPTGGAGIWTYELAAIHDHFITRYGEIGPNLPAGVRPGVAVKEGQHIAFVGHQNGSTMLHFEMFGNPNSKAPLTQVGNKKYLYVSHVGKQRFNRREDLLDPTMHLLIWAWAQKFGWTL